MACSVFELHQSLVEMPRERDSSGQHYTYDMYVASSKAWEYTRETSRSIRFAAVLASWFRADGSWRRGLFTGGLLIWAACLLSCGRDWVLRRHRSRRCLIEVSDSEHELNAHLRASSSHAAAFAVWNDTHDVRHAAGITDGLCAIDDGLCANKILREQAFPFELIRQGSSFQCQDGQASVVEDRERILATIGAGQSLLNEKMHGVVAGCSLRRVFEQGETAAAEFVEVIRRAKNRELTLNLLGSCGDTEKNVNSVLEVADEHNCQKLSISSAAIHRFDETALMQLSSLTALDVSGCSRLRSLPDSIGELRQLTTLDVRSCLLLRSLPSTTPRLHNLRHVLRKGCYSLLLLPDLSHLPNFQMDHYDFVEELVPALLLPLSLPGLALIGAWLVRVLSGCAWHVTPWMVAAVCWVGVFTTVPVPLLMHDMRSKWCQVRKH